MKKRFDFQGDTVTFCLENILSYKNTDVIILTSLDKEHELWKKAHSFANCRVVIHKGEFKELIAAIKTVIHDREC